MLCGWMGKEKITGLIPLGEIEEKFVIDEISLFHSLIGFSNKLSSLDTMCIIRVCVFPDIDRYQQQRKVPGRKGLWGYWHIAMSVQHTQSAHAHTHTHTHKDFYWGGKTKNISEIRTKLLIRTKDSYKITTSYKITKCKHVFLVCFHIV